VVVPSPLSSASLFGQSSTVPLPRADTVPRRALLEHLDQASHARLTLISAPAGAGKTTLLCQWLAQHTANIAWLPLSARENDSVIFWSRLVASVRAFDDDFGGLTMALVHGGEAFSELDLAAAFASDLGCLMGHAILAFDNMQAIQNPAILAALGSVLEQLPDDIHLVMATRTDPDLPLSRLRALGHLTELRSDDLKFNLNESREFLMRMDGLTLSHREIDLLHGRTEGWAAGLRLAAAALAVQGASSTLISTFGGNHPHVFDYFSEEVLRDLPEDLQSFLVQTSIVHALCASLCEAITGQTHGQATLRRLGRMNLFLIPLDDQSRWYRYHHCFADALAGRLEDEGPERIEELHIRAMHWYQQRGLMREVVHHALAAAQFEAAADAIETLVDELIWERGEISELLGWLAALPAGVLRSRSRLCLAHAWALALSGQLQTIEDHLALAEKGLNLPVRARSARLQVAQTASRTGQSALAEIAAVRAIAAGLQIDTARLASSSSEAVSHAPDSRFLRSVLALSRGRAHDIAADTRDAIVAYAEARDLSESVGNTHIMAVATSRLAELWAKQGELHQAADTHRSVLRLADDETDRESAVGAMAHVGIGELLYEWNDLEAATHHFEEGLKRASTWGHLETLKGSYYGLARVRQAEGAGDEAQELLTEAETVARHSNAVRGIAWVHAMQARLSLARGNMSAATSWLETSPLHPETEPLHLFTGEYTTLIRLLIAQHEHDEALVLLDGLFQIASAEHWMGLLIELLILQSLALYERGSHRASVLTLRKAVALAAPEGYVRTFLDEGDAVGQLLARASSDSAMPPYLDTLLTAFQKRDPGTASASWIDQGGLTRREREVLRHIAAGESNHEIADRLVLSPATVKRHASSIFGKLGVASRTQAVARARQRGLL
jgi:LuxR family maltose regulon positive regulatory protein